MAKIKIDWTRIGQSTVSIIQRNSGIIVGGLSMIGLALLCKKLNLPYDVLTDPFGNGTVSIRPRTVDARPMTSNIMFLPSNSVEASIAALCDNAKSMSSSFYKCNAVSDIYNLLFSVDDLDDSTKTYAIMAIRSIADTTSSSYYKSCMMDTISKIATEL